MKVIPHDFTTNIILKPEEMEYLCKPGEGANTCIWLVLGSEGFECTCLNKPTSLYENWRAGKTVAKRDGCEFVKSIDTVELGPGEHELEVLIKY
jgi:hypothetical protein